VREIRARSDGLATQRDGAFARSKRSRLRRSAPDKSAVKRVIISSYDRPGHPYYNGGGAAEMEVLALRLAAEYDVTFLTAAHRGIRVVRDELHYRELPIGWAGPRSGQLLFHLMLPFLARRMAYDVWIENFTPPFSTSFLPLFSKSNVIGVAQSLSGEHMSRRYKLPFFLIERLGLRFYRTVVVLNPADEAKILQVKPSIKTVSVIPNGVDLPLVDRATLGTGEYILFLGRIDVWHKGIDLMLDAYKKSNISMPLLIAGSGTKREERRLEQLLGVAGGNARWVGHVAGKRKCELLERCAFMVMPSRVEAFGVSALEGMAYGKPVVHFDLDTLYWMSGDVPVPSYDVNELAATFRELAQSRELRQGLGREAYEAAQMFGEDMIADRYAELLHRVLDAEQSSM